MSPKTKAVTSDESNESNQSVFSDWQNRIYRDRFRATLLVDHLVGGIPSDPRVAEGWIKKNLGADNEELIAEMVVKTMMERDIDQSAAVDQVVKTTKLNGFKRDHQGLFIEGRQVKAAIKEASNISWPKASWGPTRKGTRGFWAEHVFVLEDRIHLGVSEPTGVQQRFVSTFRGTGIQYEEYVEGAKMTFTVATDAGDAITDDQWGELWTRGEMQGIGSTRSQGYGRYTVIGWDRLK